MACPSPNIIVQETVDAEHPLSLQYGFRMDNVTGVQNLSVKEGYSFFLLYPNPVYEPFDEEVKYYKSDYLTINVSFFELYAYSVALQSLKDLGSLTCGSFLKLFRHLVGLPGRVIIPSQGPYLHRTAQHKKTQTNMHALSGIRTHDPSVPAMKAHASDRTASVSGTIILRN
jgi:hypothetical protein